MSVEIKSRKPTGQPSWPLFLVEGGEKTGKSYAAAQLTTSGRFSRAFFVDWGNEGSADEFGMMPGAEFEIVEHDGSFRAVANQIYAIREFARAQEAAGEKPVLLIIDSMTQAWELLKDEALQMARSTRAAKEKLFRDPHADIPVPMYAWNAVGDKHGRLMSLLSSFPGVVVMTARGKEITAVDDNGKPIPGSRVYRVEGHKNLAFDASVVVRMSREHPPRVIGMRHPLSGRRPMIDKPIDVPNKTLEEITWGILFKDAPKPPQVRQLAVAARAPQGQPASAGTETYISDSGQAPAAKEKPKPPVSAAPARPEGFDESNPDHVDLANSIEELLEEACAGIDEEAEQPMPVEKMQNLRERLRTHWGKAKIAFGEEDEKTRDVAALGATLKSLIDKSQQSGE